MIETRKGMGGNKTPANEKKGREEKEWQVEPQKKRLLDKKARSRLQ